jgi:hypothetical protein
MSAPLSSVPGPSGRGARHGNVCPALASRGARFRSRSQKRGPIPIDIAGKALMLSPSRSRSCSRSANEQPNKETSDQNRLSDRRLGGPGIVAAHEAPRMNFFLTSAGPGQGANLGELDGADAHLREACRGGGRDGTHLAGVSQHHQRQRSGSNRKRPPAQMDGTRFPEDGTDHSCSDWTSGGEGSAQVGHHDRVGGGDHGSSWNGADAARRTCAKRAGTDSATASPRTEKPLGQEGLEGLEGWIPGTTSTRMRPPLIPDEHHPA